MDSSTEEVSTPSQAHLYRQGREDNYNGDEDDDDNNDNDNDEYEDNHDNAEVDRRSPEEDDEEDDEEEGDDEEEDEDQSDPNSPPPDSVLSIKAAPDLKELAGLREIGSEAICWTLSSAKPGNGVEQLQDNSNDTYWQSDGAQPHLLQIQFQRRVAVSHVCVYLDYNLDESYTPKRISVEVGMTTQDLQSGVFPSVIDLHEPVGWCIIPLIAPPDPLEEQEETTALDGTSTVTNKSLVRTHLVQLAVLSMHQNGRDTHVRQVKLFGPRRTGIAAAAVSHSSDMIDAFSSLNDSTFTTVEVSQFSTIR